MVTTRAQHRRWQEHFARLRERRRERENEAVWAELENRPYDVGATPAAEVNDYPEAQDYRPNDHCKRHRKRDDSEYSETVVAYKRRKAKR